MTQELEFPARLDTEGALEFVRTLKALPKDKEYVFEFDNHRWAEPFGILYASAAIRSLRAAHPESEFHARHIEKHGYLGHVGFFNACGFNYGNRPGDAPGNQNYLPITEIETAEIYRLAAGEGGAVGELIDRDARRIAEVLIRENDGNLYDVVQYSLREILRNALEHSQSEHIYYCGQYVSGSNRVQIAILDAGIGIRSSLANNPHLEITNDADALKLAVMPGVSGKNYPGVEQRPYDEWQNSGYGLYMIQRICRHAGSFLITSEHATLSILRDRHSSADDELLPGTGIRLLLDTRRMFDLGKQLGHFSKEGQEIAQEVVGAQALKASAASLVLRKQENGGDDG